MTPNYDGLVAGLIFIGVMGVGILWGSWEMIDYLFIDDAIVVTEPITPEIRITVEDNVIDTLYIYREK